MNPARQPRRQPVSWLRLLPSAVLSFTGAGLAMACLGLAAMLFGPLPPFLFAFAAVAGVTLLAGRLAGVSTAILCVAWMATPWLPPTPVSIVPGAFNGRNATLFLVLSVGFALIASRWSSARVTLDEPIGDEAMVGARGMLLVMALAALLPFTAFVAVARYTHEQAFRQAELRADRATRIAQEHAARVFDTNEAILGRLLDLAVAPSPAALRAREPALHAQMAAITRDFPQVQSLWLFGPDGRAIASDRFSPAPVDTLDVTDRDYFRWHRTHHGGLYISEPGIGKLTRQPFFDTSRRRDDERGEFGGVVSVSLFPAYFEGFYSGLAVDEPGLSMKLARLDGTVLATFPPSRPDVSPMPRDGVPRVEAVRAVDRYPAFVTAAIAHPVIVAGWQRELVLLGGILFPMSALLVTMSWLAFRRAQREERMVRRLRAAIDSRARAEQALLQTQKLEALGLLTGSVAHDFNNILAVVANNAHLLERTTRDPGSKPLAAAIRRAVNTGTQLTRQLLSFSRRQPLRPVSVDLEETLAKTLELVRTTVGRHIEVSLLASSDLLAVTVDEAEFELALINLSLNARDAMPEGGRLTVLARNVTHAEEERVPAGARWVAIGVSDTGQGMPEAVRQRAFEPFYTTKAPGRGTGLGLSQAMAMCQQAGGAATIESSEGTGTTVTLYLPASPDTPCGPRRPATGFTDTLACELLLVEDNVEVAATTRALLESFGARVTHAASSRAALAALEARGAGFDAVLSDIMMPGAMNGLALARLLRERWPEQPVLLMTGYTAEIHTALAAGFEVLPKPCVPEDLAAAIAKAVRGRADVAG